MGGEHVRTKYERHRHRKLLFVLVCGIALIAAALTSIAVGPVRLPVADVVAALVGSADRTTTTIVWNIRLPQTLAAIVAGVSLSIAGAAMQTVLRNPLGSPFTLGVSQAAAFGAAVTIVVLGGGSVAATTSILGDLPLVSLSAFVWSLVSTAAILLLVSYTKASPETLILTGVALGSLFSASLSVLQYVATDTEVSAIVHWTFGDVGRATWGDLVVMCSVTALASAYFVYTSWNYKALNAGDETALSLGIDVDRLRIRGMVVASLLTSATIAYVGIIGFVGLVVPHIVRKVIGGDEQFLFPASALAGGTLLLLSDTVARVVVAPVVLPVGILTAFLGAPLFLYLVVTGGDHW